MVRAFAVSLAVLALSLPAAPSAWAKDSVELASSVFIESAPSKGGFVAVSRANQLSRGDKVVLLVEWTAPQGGRAFTVSAKVPATLVFQRSAQDGQQVSADGGRSWGSLGTLRIASSGRLASPEDVTHLRWTISRREAFKGSGRIAYSALVR